MGVIRGVLQEELDNSKKIVARYKEEVAKLKGSLVKKKVGNKYYYYLAIRDGKKVRFFYKGVASEAKKNEYEENKKRVKLYKDMIKKAKEQIKFLERALRGKEAV
ncbi:MAG: hypothetical protein HY920_03925 [Elusimicrobia bacterium]|nr:hypothetical protein [Elusimicrobiota bacterium]